MSNIVKHTRKIFINAGGSTDPTLITRLETLEDNENYYIYKTQINTTTGTITIPTGATIVLDQFQGGADAFCSTISGSKATLEFPLNSSGVAVDVATFDALGNFTLTGTPSSYPVALIYILKIKSKDLTNLVESDIVEEYPIEELYQKLDKTRTVSITTSLTITLDISLYDQYNVTALASTLTINNPIGTPYSGQKIIYRLKDNGTARALTFDSNFRFSSDLIAPTTTIINKTLYLGFVWNSTDSKWDNLAQLNNFT